MPLFICMTIVCKLPISSSVVHAHLIWWRYDWEKEGSTHIYFFFWHQETGTIYTHHQKSVIVDADAGNNRRKIVTFVGGLDLCKGRYDTPKHQIFSTLQTIHKEDFHNPNFTVRFYLVFLYCLCFPRARISI